MERAHNQSIQSLPCEKTSLSPFPAPGKLYGSTLLFDMSKLAMDIIGDRGVLWGASGQSNGIAPYSLMESFSLLIGGGTANIQRNLIAKRGLGLPR